MTKKKADKKKIKAELTEAEKVLQRQKASETFASFGLLLVCISLVVPFATVMNTEFLRIFKWVYAAGALLYLIGRVIPASEASESLRARRLRRLEAWGGIAFAIGAFFWFYNDSRLGLGAGALGVLNETITFTIVGAMLQLIGAFLLRRENKKR